MIENIDLYLTAYKSSMDQHLWSEIAGRLIEEKEDIPLVELRVDKIISSSDDFDNFGRIEDALYNVLIRIQKKYFPILWAKLTDLFLHPEDKGIAIFHLRSLLGQRISNQFGNTSLLFRGRPLKEAETIIEWGRENPTALHWLASFLPVYSDSDGTSAEWHPWTIKFIDAFGNEGDLLTAIGATLGNYSWSGSIVPKLENEKKLFEELLQHQRADVRPIAERYVRNLEERIR